MSWKKVKDKTLSGKEDIINGNALIAKFEGYSIDDSGDFFNGIHYYKLDGDKKYSELTIETVRSFTNGFVWNYHSLTERRYDTSWDLLMPVIKKIQDSNQLMNITTAIKMQYDIIVDSLKEHENKNL